MSITLSTYNTGDSDYIAKLNNDNTNLTTAIDSLQAALGTGTTISSLAILLASLLEVTPAIIGNASYSASISTTSVVVLAGYGWKSSTQTIVKSTTTANLSFVGKAAGTYYIVIDSAGAPGISASNVDSLYSVVWNGTTTLSALTRLANVLMNADNDTDMLHSTALGVNYPTLLARIEAIEAALHSQSPPLL